MVEIVYSKNKCEQAFFNEWKKIVKNEEIQVEIINNKVYAFGSELACLRLRNKINGKVGESTNKQNWFFEMDDEFNLKYKNL